MTQTATALRAYQRTQVESRSPLELVVLLYDGAIQSIGMARDAMRRRDLTAKRDAMSRAVAIVSELRNTLNLERGGDVAQSLDRLYAHVLSLLVEANMHLNARPLDQAERVLQEVREGWVAIASGRTAAPQAHP